MRPDIVLVGNGPSAVARELGGEIDSFRTVVRFNEFETAGFEQFVGFRTDVWVTVGCYIRRPEQLTRARRTIRTPQLFKRIIFFGFGNVERYETFQQLRAECDAAGRSVERFDPKLWERVQKTMPLDEPNEKGRKHGVPSTGMVAIAHFLDFYPCVATVGFDCMAGDDHHYWQPGNAHLHGHHTPAAEAARFRAWVEEGRVVQL